MKSTLTVGELFTMEKELVGLKDQRTNATYSKGLLSQKIDGSEKYDLLELWEDVLAPNKKHVETIQNEIIKELGIADDQGGYTIPQFIEKEVPGTDGNPDTVKQIPNPAFDDFTKRVQEILEKEKEFEHAEFSKDKVLNFSSEEVYPIFNRLLRLIKKHKESK